MSLIYLGDLSKQDVQVLATEVLNAQSILEFGVGASTQIICQTRRNDLAFYSVETDPVWIGHSQRELKSLGVNPKYCEFILYSQWHETVASKNIQFDVIFVDGVDDKRLEFAKNAWDMLRVGGRMLFHDTRRSGDMAKFLQLVESKYLEVDVIKLNHRASNISIVRKKISEPYIDWNVAEKKEPWMSAQVAPPSGWVQKMKDFISNS